MTIFRKLMPGDRAAYRDHLLRLSAPERHARFCGAVSDAVVSGLAARLDWAQARLVGCFDADGLLRGVAELRLDPARPGRGEVAASVEAALQGRGVGNALVRRILTVARNRGIRTLDLHCLADNRRLQAIVRRAGGTVEHEAGEATGLILLPRLDQLSLWQEAIDDLFALAVPRPLLAA